MQKFIVLAAIVACAAAAPGLFVAHETPIVAAVHHAPIVPVYGAKSTITKSSQIVNHGSPVVHAVHAAPIVHAVPVVHAAPVVHAPLLVKTAPSAVSHSSSVSLHHAHAPLVAIH